MRAWILAALVAIAALAGCADPHRAVVAEDALVASGLEWKETVGEVQKGGIFGADRVLETRYAHAPEGRDDPYHGTLQVFSIREVQRTPDDELLALASRLVAQAAEREGIVLDEDLDHGGSRELASGALTVWETRQGTIKENADGFFPGEATVRILAEAGHDGRSSTSFVIIAIAQIAEEDSTPVFGGTRTDARTWNIIAGDPDGSIAGSTHATGLVYNLVTHA